MPNFKMALAILIVFSVVCPALIAGPLGTVEGRVVDVEGAAISSAAILIRPDAAGRTAPRPQAYIQTTTDKTGHFSRRLEIGFYDICMMQNGFTPKCQKILIKPGQPTRVEAQLEISDLVVQAVGDGFDTR